MKNNKVRQQQYDTTPEQYDVDDEDDAWLGNNNMIPHQNPFLLVS